MVRANFGSNVGHEFETPHELISRLKIGREEFLQRLITSLILDGPYPKWNSRSTPSSSGTVFLRALHGLSFDTGWEGDDITFVDELELLGRSDDEKGGAPDWAVLWPNRIWIIELKSEAGSHRHDQVPSYFDLARYHYPGAAIDLTYLTPPMHAPFEPSTPQSRYAHVTWEQVVPLVRAHWGDSDSSSQQACVDGVSEGIGNLHLPPRAWLDSYVGVNTPVAEPEASEVKSVITEELFDIERAMELVVETAADHRQQAIDVRFDGLDSLLEARNEIHETIVERSEPGSPLRHVRAWPWRWESTGSPLTASGNDVGMELRLSRYQKPQF